MSSWRTVGDLALLSIYALPAIASPIDYAMTPGWRRTPLGRHLMAYMVVVAWFAVLGLYRVLVGPEAVGLEIARAVGYFALGFVVWWRWILVHRWRRLAQQAQGGTLDPPHPHTEE